MTHLWALSAARSKMSRARFCKPHVIFLTAATVITFASTLHLLSCKHDEQPHPDCREVVVSRGNLGVDHVGPQRNFTVVTAYFNLGSIQKDAEAATRGPSAYQTWMWPYRHIRNAVVAYFDDASFAASFAELRDGLPTKVVVVNRSQMWSFSLKTRIQAIFAQPDYPKHHPKSTDAAYVSAMHAKYEVMAQAVQDNPFGSLYFAWMDLGIYRYLPSDEAREFMLQTPRCHRDNSIMFARIYPMGEMLTTSYVLRDGLDWVGGGFFVAKRDIMLDFCQDYKKHVTMFLSGGLANHDQSVILAMYLPLAATKPVVSLQAIITRGDDPWFYLALEARRDGLAAASNDSVTHRVCCSYELYE